MNKSVLLLIPGMLNTAAVWRPVIERLKDVADIRIADVQTQATIAAMAKDAWALVQDVSPGTPLVLCGFSMGGFVAIEMLASGSRSASALCLIDSSAQPESPESCVQREKTIVAIGRDFDKVTAGVAQFCTCDQTHDNAALMRETLDIMRSVGAATAIQQNQAIMGRSDHRAALAQLAIPTLVLCGRENKVTPPALSEELAALIPGAQLAWIANAGHMTPLEQPAEIAERLGTLMKSLV